jgi:homocysteine S-methyltransferase
MPLPLVAASAGPYGAYLADGSEYRGDYSLTEKEYHDFHRRRVEIFVEAGADIIAFETVPSYAEACAIASLMEEFSGMEYWISFTVKDGEHISCGRTFADCMRMLSGRDNLAAAGINCSAPSLFTPLLESAADIMDKPFIVYPNSGEMYNPVDHKWCGESGAEQIEILAHEWYGLGARIIGGCCRTGPNNTAMLYKARKKIKLRS